VFSAKSKVEEDVPDGVGTNIISIPIFFKWVVKKSVNYFGVGSDACMVSVEAQIKESPIKVN